MPNSLKCRLKNLAYHQGLLSEKDLSRIYTDNDVVAELEKIKADIDEIVEREMEEDMRWSLGLRHSKKIIDNHISELKGE